MAECTIEFEFSIGDEVRFRACGTAATVVELLVNDSGERRYDVGNGGTRWCLLAGQIELVEDGDKSEAKK